MTEDRRRQRPTELSLRSGLALPPDDAADLAGQRRVAMIALVGPTASGKTTLIAGCLQHFSEAVPDGLWFKGSRTIMALEELCHPWRLASGRTEPASIHTELDHEGLLHLELQRREDRETVDLMFADISGEWFDRVRHGVDTLDHFPVLQRSDHVTFCLDGERIADAGERHVAVGEIRDLIRVWSESAWLRPGVRPTLVLTKWDRLAGDPDLATVSEGAMQALANFASKHAIDLRLSRTALRTSPDRHTEAGFGIADLLGYWTDELPPWGDPDRVPEPPQALRAIDRLEAGANA